MEIDTVETDLTWIVVNSLTTAKELVQSKSVVIREEIESPLPQVIVNKKQLNYLLNELLHRAAQATTCGQITVRAKRINGTHLGPTYIEPHVQISIIDTGHGVASPLNDLFQQIIHRSGGRFWAEYNLGHGATHTFTLPLSH